MKNQTKMTFTFTTFLFTAILTACFTTAGYMLDSVWGHEKGVNEVLTLARSTPAERAEPFDVVITGAVKHPGIYQLSAPARLQDAVRQAGGLLEQAAETTLHLLDQPVYAGQILHIPHQQASRSHHKKTHRKKNRKTARKIKTKRIKKRSSHQTPLQATPHHKIDINRATVKELTALKGVGPALAKRIVAHRKKQKFTRIQQIQQVKGIGKGKFSKIQRFITVGR